MDSEPRRPSAGPISRLAARPFWKQPADPQWMSGRSPCQRPGDSHAAAPLASVQIAHTFSKETD